jgi:DNA replication and repair protein RecF
MYLQSLSIFNYKNIRQAEIEFSPKINCFIGSNGSGKTNALDTIYYLSYCKSHNNSIDTQNIAHDADFFVIQGKYIINGVEEDIHCGLKRKQRKIFKRNKKEYDRLSEHMGVLPLVLISPDDSKLIAEGSDERRRFIDSIISQHNKEYLYTLIRYNNALSQRNSLLKNRITDNSIFEIWEEQLAELGSFIYEKRIEFIEQFIPIFESFYQFLSENNESVSLRYISHLQNSDSLQNQLSKSRERDSILGYTTKGIHKDELEMLLGNYPIKKEGSQGQNKTYLIALKFAQFDFLKRLSKITPILLLDDIFDKLDSNRVKQIIRLVSEDNFGQIFITDTNREHLDEILKQIQQDARIFTVEKGEISLK